MLSYGDLRDAARAFAAALLARGLRHGDRVALFLDNSPDFLIAYLGTWWAGGTVVLVNTAYRQVELRHILSDSAARLCVSTGLQRTELERIRADLPALEAVVESVAAPPADRLLSLPAQDDIAIIAYTSGTTGRSKGAMLAAAQPAGQRPRRVRSLALDRRRSSAQHAAALSRAWSDGRNARHLADRRQRGTAPPL